MALTNTSVNTDKHALFKPRADIMGTKSKQLDSLLIRTLVQNFWLLSYQLSSQSEPPGAMPM